MHNQDTLNIENHARARSTWAGGLFVAAGLTLLAMATPTYGQDAPSQPNWSQAVAFTETIAVRDLPYEPLTPEEMAQWEAHYQAKPKNEYNLMRVKPPYPLSHVLPFMDRALNNYKHQVPNAVTNPIANFDGPDADAGAAIFGGRTAPPDTNGAVGPNHFVITTNLGVRIYDKSGVPAGPQFKLSALMAGIPNAADDDGDPVVLYDSLADRWVLMQFNLRVTSNTTHFHFAVSTTGDPTGTYFAYDFLGNTGRAGDYPHIGVWNDAYYMSTNDFTPPLAAPFLGASCYAMDRAKMLVGDPTASRVGFTLSTAHGGMLPTNFQGFTPPPVGTPNLFIEFFDTGFDPGDPDFLQAFAFHADFVTPANSTLTNLGFIETLGFDGRNPAGRTDIQQPPPGEGLDGINDRLMHPLNFRMLPGGIQSYVMNFTVNVSGVNPTDALTYQGGVRWFELRRNAGTGALTIAQQASYAPGAPSPATGRDLWMASVAQDGEGNIALAASASDAVALTPTAIYTGRLASDPINTLPQGEVNPLAVAGVVGGVQTATANRWGDYSSLFVDPADECTFWGAFEYVDAPTASFDWNTRVFSFKVNPDCATPARGTITGTITACGAGTPIQDAIATTQDGYMRQTNASGTFTMTVAPGDYQVNVIGEPGSGFGTCFQNVTVPPGGNAVVDCCLGVGSPTPIPSPSPSPSGTPSPPPSPTPSASPTPPASPTPTPSPTPRAQAVNLSTRMLIGTGDSVGIGGFIITGAAPKHVLIRGIGPSLFRVGIENPLADPVLELHGPSGLIDTNNNWRDTQEQEIQDTGIPPTNDFESAIDATLAPGAYTAIVKGNGANNTGVGLVELYDLDASAASKLGNISTRAFVNTGSDIVIAGFMLANGGGNDNVIIRGLGPSLSANGLSPVLANPTLELRNSDGTLLLSNNDWQDNTAQAAAISASGLAPTNSLEAAVAATLGPGVYTALLAGLNNGTGFGLVEVYDRGAGGQLFTATLTGAQEVPPNASTATGTGTVLLSDDQTTITVNLSFTGLTDPATAAHIHGPAGPGVNAPVIFGLNGVPNATSGAIPEQSFAISPAEAADLINGLHYFNIHNTTFPGGEIRGQIAGAPVVPTPTPTPPGASPSPSSTPPGGTPSPTPPGASPSPSPPPASPTPSPSGPCIENFDGQSTLPPGWTETIADGPPPPWAISTSSPDSGANSAFVSDTAVISDKRLDSRPIAISSAAAVISFRNNYNFEFSMGTFWDGGVLEVSINGGAFVDVTHPTVSDGTFVSGGYNGTIDSTADNPLSSQPAWASTSGGYITSTINLIPALQGQSIVLRWRCGTDQAEGAPGWHVDSLMVTGGACPP